MYTMTLIRMMWARVMQCNVILAAASKTASEGSLVAARSDPDNGSCSLPRLMVMGAREGPEMWM